MPADDHSSKGNHVSFSASTEAVSGDGGDAAVMADGDTTAMLATVPGDEEPEEGEQEDWFFNEDLLCARHSKKCVLMSAKIDKDNEDLHKIKH